jgi:hypothetical protein
MKSRLPCSEEFHSDVIREDIRFGIGLGRVSNEESGTPHVKRADGM